MYIIIHYNSNESLSVINHKRQQSYYKFFFTKCSTVLLSVIMINEKETINFIYCFITAHCVLHISL